jgi:hypothetical protein
MSSQDGDLTPKVPGVNDLPPPNRGGADAQPPQEVGFILYDPSFMKEVLRKEAEAMGLPWAIVQSKVYQIVDNLYSQGFALTKALGTNRDIIRENLVLKGDKLTIAVRVRSTPTGGIKTERA